MGTRVDVSSRRFGVRARSGFGLARFRRREGGVAAPRDSARCTARTCSPASTLSRSSSRKRWNSRSNTALTHTASTSESCAFGRSEGSEDKSLSDSSHSVGSCFLVGIAPEDTRRRDTRARTPSRLGTPPPRAGSCGERRARGGSNGCRARVKNSKNSDCRTSEKITTLRLSPPSR